MTAWGQWMERHAADIVEVGSPLGKTKKVSAGGVSDIRNNLTGYVIVEAKSHEAAARMFETLAERRINLLAVSASEIKVSALIAEDQLELAVRVLHTAFGLDADQAA